jgi:alpha-galactosidase/6-phospho-beta-glucosidase family protein
MVTNKGRFMSGPAKNAKAKTKPTSKATGKSTGKSDVKSTGKATGKANKTSKSILQAASKTASKKALKSFKKIQTKIQKKIQTSIQTSIKQELPQKINETLSTLKAPRVVQKAKRRAHETAQMATQIATDAAKNSLDQVLLNLEHRGLSIKESQDLAIKVGKKVLERAEAIRSQLAENSLSPQWLKEVRIKIDDENAKQAPISDVTSDLAADLASDPTAVSAETLSTESAAAQGMAEPAHPEREFAGASLKGERGHDHNQDGHQ